MQLPGSPSGVARMSHVEMVGLKVCNERPDVQWMLYNICIYIYNIYLVIYIYT